MRQRIGAGTAVQSLNKSNDIPRRRSNVLRQRGIFVGMGRAGRYVRVLHYDTNGDGTPFSAGRYCIWIKKSWQWGKKRI